MKKPTKFQIFVISNRQNSQSTKLHCTKFRKSSSRSLTYTHVVRHVGSDPTCDQVAANRINQQRRRSVDSPAY